MRIFPAVLTLVAIFQATAADFSGIKVEAQPLGANVERLVQALDFLGANPFSAEEKSAIDDAISKRDAATIQKILHSHVLLEVKLNPESRVKVARGGLEKPNLQQGGYLPFLIRIENQAAVTAPLRISSPQAGKVYAGVAELSMKRQQRPDLRQNQNTEGATDRFLDVEMFGDQPMTPNLSGLEVEYAIALIYSNEPGKREATISFDVGDSQKDIGFRGETPVLFDVKPAIPVTLKISDHDGKPTTARLVFQDERGRIYPPQGKRLAPDLFFQKQIYRPDGGKVFLPPGKFTVQSSRGPEYQVQTRTIEITDQPAELEFNLERWVNSQAFGFYSGDHHIHASGCAHYQFPTVGIDPAHVLPHVKGEGLNVGCILTWGPGFEHQRQFFKPDSDPISEPTTLIKYDLEISGFGSAPLGHVCLLNLKNQTYPGSEGTKLKGWPSWTIPVMRWTKEQGGVAGYAHSASGLHIEPDRETARLLKKLDENGNGAISETEAGDQLLPESFDTIETNGDNEIAAAEMEASLARVAEQLPNYAIPGMNGAGALEIAVSSVEGVCDFISAMDTARIQEWNTWYHILNCGLDVKVSGETDFPCMSGTRVGQGRVYVKLGAGIENLNYGEWCRGMADGKSYVSDGYAHALEFSVAGIQPGFGEVKLEKAGEVKITTKVAFSPETPIGVPYGTANSPLGRAKIGDTVDRHIGLEDGTIKGGDRLVEIILNGEVVATKKVPADGKEHDLEFQIPIEKSSWVALRHFPQLHTNPVNVIVGEKPIRANPKSARWCVEMIEKLWENRHMKIRPDEKEAAAASYERAKAYYRKIASTNQQG
ncbi:MAG: CehA/McbA family metallohydrolase [Verrucomicrobiales bacterium]